MSTPRRASGTTRAPLTSTQCAHRAYDPTSIVRLPRQLYYGGELPAQAVRVAAKIIKLGYRSDVGCTMQLDRLAWQLGINPSTADRAVKSLTKARVLTTRERITSTGSRPAERHVVPPRRRGVSGWVDVEVGALDRIRSGPQFVAYAEALFLARTGQLVTSSAIASALGVRTAQAVQHLARLEALYGVVKPLHRAGPGGVNLYLVAAARGDRWINSTCQSAPPRDTVPRGPSVQRRLHELRRIAAAKHQLRRPASSVAQATAQGTRPCESAVQNGENSASYSASTDLSGGPLNEAPAGGRFAAPGDLEFEAPNTVNLTVECDVVELDSLVRPAVSARNVPGYRGNLDDDDCALAESGADAPGRTQHSTDLQGIAADPRVGALTGKAAEFVTTTLDAWDSRDTATLAKIREDSEWCTLLAGVVARVEQREAASSNQVTYVVNGLGWHARNLASGKLHAIRVAVYRALQTEVISPNRLAVRLQSHLRRFEDRGEPIRDLVAWVKGVGLIRPFGCDDPDCEDGLIWDTWQRCALCDQRKRERALGNASSALSALPRQLLQDQVPVRRQDALR